MATCFQIAAPNLFQNQKYFSMLESSKVGRVIKKENVLTYISVDIYIDIILCAHPNL